MKFVLSILFLLVAGWLGGCYFEPGIVAQGHIRGRHIEGDKYVLSLVDTKWDTLDVSTTRETYMYMPDYYFTARADSSSLIRRKPCR